MLNTYKLNHLVEITFKMSGMILFGPLEEKGATTGASKSHMDSLFNIIA